MLQRFESLEMDLQKLLERLRDPLAGADGERCLWVPVGGSRRRVFFFFFHSFFSLPLFFFFLFCSLFLNVYIHLHSFSSNPIHFYLDPQSNLIQPNVIRSWQSHAPTLSSSST